MPHYFVDLHIHLGATLNHNPVKITASNELNLLNVIEECVERKGLNIIGIVDCASPPVIKDIETLIEKGVLFEIEDGGLSYRDQLTVLLGAEVESLEKNGGRGHYLSFFPTLSQMKSYTSYLSQYIKNINLSTQQSYRPARELGEITQKIGGLFLPAHAFTPHKSLFGSCGDSLKAVFSDFAPFVKVLELGLSSDSQMADCISELHRLTFVSNSDAHSLATIGREYNIFELAEPTFKAVKEALFKENGRLVANFGLDPKLGKYHRSFCEDCQQTLVDIDWLGCCPFCSGKKIVKGVYDRLLEISDSESFSSAPERPPYYYQIPLSFLPGVGPKTIKKLISYFGTEMEVLHRAGLDELTQVVGREIAELIDKARHGQLDISPGGGGIYGKVTAT